MPSRADLVRFHFRLPFSHDRMCARMDDRRLIRWSKFNENTKISFEAAATGTKIQDFRGEKISWIKFCFIRRVDLYSVVYRGMCVKYGRVKQTPRKMPTRFHDNFSSKFRLISFGFRISGDVKKHFKHNLIAMNKRLFGLLRGEISVCRNFERSEHKKASIKSRESLKIIIPKHTYSPVGFPHFDSRYVCKKKKPS